MSSPAAAPARARLNAIVFSKDRACQLELLLRSVRRHWPEAIDSLRVLYTASTTELACGYDAVRRLHDDVELVPEPAGRFRERLLELVQQERELTVFLVDDDVFVRPLPPAAVAAPRLVDRPELLCLSLRLGRRIAACYTQGCDTPPPDLGPDCTWRWRGLAGDWGYPMSLDGHVFRTTDVLPLLRRLAFFDPNSLEVALAAEPPPYEEMACLDEPRLLNVPANRVQETAPNRHCGVGAEYLNRRLLDGWRVRLEPIEAVENVAPHHPLDYEWERIDGGCRPVVEPPRVSVVIPCYEQARYLPEAVESVLGQTYRSFEVVVVDDGSPDDTAATVERLRSLHRDAPIRLLRQDNAGLPAARNAGIAAARGELVLPLDADDLIGSTFLAETVAALDAHPEASIAYGGQQNFGADHEFHPHGPYDFRRETIMNLIGVASLFRRSAWEDAGGYGPLDSYEDWDFWIACGEHGHFGVHVPTAHFYYRVRPGSMFALAVERDRHLKAQIVLRHPRLYSPEQRRWARGVLAGEPAALAVPDRVTWMPVFGAHAQAPVATRSVAFLADAAELVADPATLAAYFRAFEADDDATLVVYAPGWREETLTELLVLRASQAGLDLDAGPDLLALTTKLSELDARRRALAVDARGSRWPADGAFAGVPAAGWDELGALRGHWLGHGPHRREAA